TRILAETDENGVTRYYQITRDSEGKEVRMQVERTESGNFRTLAGALITGAIAGGVATKVISQQPTPQQQEQINKTQITLKLSIMRYERADAKEAVPAAAIGTVLFSKFKKIADGDVNIPDTAYTHVEETKTGERRTVKWMRTEAHWKREAGMLQHLKSERYVSDLYTLYSLPAFAEYRYVSIIGSFSRTLESYISTEHLSLSQICLLALSLSNALRWCHEHHVVHLNINPVSFYLAGVPGQDLVYLYGWKLWNFGYARFVGEAVAVDTSVANAMYAAPEILNDKNGPNQRVLADPSMDRWSLGVVLCEVFTHKKLFRSGALAELQLTGTENSAAFEPDLSSIQDKNVKTAIRGLIEVDAEKRFGYEKLLELLS
ncbi:Serine/threonine-protein kinase ulk2, partial [Actinomortierella ambigua]